MPALISRWTADLLVLAPSADPRQVHEAGADLLRRWTQPHRRYHTTQHLVEVLRALEDLLGDTADGRVGRVAGWLHDAVYDVHAPPGDNELRSAGLAHDLLPTLGVAPEVADAIADLVEMTADHAPTASTGPGDAFHDADLWILAAPPDRFDEHCAQVRDEYAHVPDTAYARARDAVLRPLADRPRLYRTPPAVMQWTGQARDNLRRELHRLRAAAGARQERA